MYEKFNFLIAALGIATYVIAAEQSHNEASPKSTPPYRGSKSAPLFPTVANRAGYVTSNAGDLERAKAATTALAQDVAVPPTPMQSAASSDVLPFHDGQPVATGGIDDEPGSPAKKGNINPFRSPLPASGSAGDYEDAEEGSSF